MKYEITTNESGQVAISIQSSFKPPLGLVLPAKQDVRTTVASATALSTLITSSHPAIPEGLEIHASDLFVFADGHWLKQSDESNADSTEVSGVIHFRNNANYDIGITW